jgi:hypothetical protein
MKFLITSLIGILSLQIAAQNSNPGFAVKSYLQIGKKHLLNRCNYYCMHSHPTPYGWLNTKLPVNG